MKILHISDTHGLHKQLANLPQADVIVHSGDFTEHGTEAEVLDFVNWFCDLPYKYKIFIAGNHDDCLAGEFIEGLDEDCYYLNGDSVVIDGVKFHGIPLFVADQLDGRFFRLIEDIPTDTDVLITHCPPLGVLDFTGGTHYGEFSLLQKVSDIKPKYHLFGHVHPQNGVTKSDGTEFINASLISADRKQISSESAYLIDIKDNG